MGGGDTDNYWEVAYRVYWYPSTTRTVTLTGELELVLGPAGGAYKVIAEAAKVAGFSGQASGSTTIESKTATSDYGPSVIVASSGGRMFRTC